MSNTNTNHYTETDYLIVGSGATGMAFADTLLTELPDAHITIVDRHGKPGGHWNDAYPFVALHQPSAIYGVNSMELGERRIDTVGVNKGLYELATGPEINGYYDRVMNHRLLPSGRVSYHPMCNYVGDGRFVSLLSGAQTQVTVRKKTVNARHFSPSVPATHQPKFSVAEGSWLLPPGGLVHLWQTGSRQARRYVILGAGKTAMDVGVWLLKAGVPGDAIQWVVPRDSWLINRQYIQPGVEFFNDSIGGQADQMEAFASATSIADLYARLEACGAHLRIDTTRQPSMFHLASISRGEVELLRGIKNVVRMGHVKAITADELVLEQGRLAIDDGTVCIDCTASAVEQRQIQPIFQGSNIVLQVVRLPLPTFSAALIAYVEAHYDDDAHKNKLCASIPFPDSPAAYPAAMLVSMMNQAAWGQDKALRTWIRESRLDGFGRVVAAADPNNPQQMAILERLRNAAPAAAANLAKLAAAQRRAAANSPQNTP